MLMFTFVLICRPCRLAILSCFSCFIHQIRQSGSGKYGMVLDAPKLHQFVEFQHYFNLLLKT
jgi:hypothetical protein